MGFSVHNDDYDRGHKHGRVEGASQQRRADAETVRAVGCLCFEMRRASMTDKSFPFVGDIRFEGELLELFAHDPRCPQALAKLIQEG
jgi:hypothetical protein